MSFLVEREFDDGELLRNCFEIVVIWSCVVFPLLYSPRNLFCTLTWSATFSVVPAIYVTATFLSLVWCWILYEETVCLTSTFSLSLSLEALVRINFDDHIYDCNLVGGFDRFLRAISARCCVLKCFCCCSTPTTLYTHVHRILMRKHCFRHKCCSGLLTLSIFVWSWRENFEVQICVAFPAWTRFVNETTKTLLFVISLFCVLHAVISHGYDHNTYDLSDDVVCRGMPRSLLPGNCDGFEDEESCDDESSYYGMYVVLSIG